MGLSAATKHIIKTDQTVKVTITDDGQGRFGGMITTDNSTQPLVQTCHLHPNRDRVEADLYHLIDLVRSS